MRLVLVRHAVAAEAPPPGGSDDDRALTEKGRRRFRAAARGLVRLLGPIDRVLTSPLPRAAETARILAAAADLPVPPEPCAALGPGGGPGALVAALRGASPAATIAVVGHEPDLSTLASFLLAPGGARVELSVKKGGATVIDVEALPPPSGGLLLLHLSPRALRLVGRRSKRD
jgi:phosphohistidine phosphatase